MDADLYILPECFSKEHISLHEEYDMLWCGDDDLTEKGLGVIWKKNLSVHVIPEYKKIKHMLPVIVNGSGFPQVYSCLMADSLEREEDLPSITARSTQRVFFLS